MTDAPHGVMEQETEQPVPWRNIAVSTVAGIVVFGAMWHTAEFPAEGMVRDTFMLGVWFAGVAAFAGVYGALDRSGVRWFCGAGALAAAAAVAGIAALRMAV